MMGRSTRRRTTATAAAAAACAALVTFAGTGIQPACATPLRYEDAYHPSVKEAMQAMKQNEFELLQEKAGNTKCDFENIVSEDCCGIDTEEQGQWYTQNKALNCRIAGADFKYIYAPNVSDPTTFVEAEAKAGDVILGAGGDSTFAPALLRPSCYFGLGCGEGEFCLVDVQVPQNPWAGGPQGQTPDPYGICQDAEYIARAKEGGDFKKTYELFCGNMPPDPAFQVGVVDYAYNPYNDNPIYSKCVAYKKENEPCLPNLSYGSKYGPVFNYRSNDLPFDPYSQGFVCAPGLKCTSKDAYLPNTCIPESADESTHFDADVKVVRKENESCEGDRANPKYVCDDGLVCTPSAVYVWPNTCVKPRPKDICYYGPWWNSNACPRVEAPDTAGLDWNQSIEAMKRFIVLFPSDLAGPGDASYWCPEQDSSRPALKDQITKSQDILYNILEALFPMDLFPGETLPTKEELLQSVIGDEFIGITENCGRNVEQILDSNSAEGKLLASDLALAAQFGSQPNQVWSLLHFMTFNLPEKITQDQVTASQAMSTYLSQGFWCTDCRSLYTKIIDVVTGPPSVATGQAQADYWWLAHNIASEHVAATVGGHPFVYNINDQQKIPGSGRYSGKEVRSIQNNFYLPYEDAEAMWRVIPYDGGKEGGSDGSGGDQDGSDGSSDGSDGSSSDSIIGDIREGIQARLESIRERIDARLGDIRG